MLFKRFLHFANVLWFAGLEGKDAIPTADATDVHTPFLPKERSFCTNGVFLLCSALAQLSCPLSQVRFSTWPSPPGLNYTWPCPNCPHFLAPPQGRQGAATRLASLSPLAPCLCVPCSWSPCPQSDPPQSPSDVQLLGACCLSSVCLDSLFLSGTQD